VKTPTSIGIKINLHFLQISGTWKPNDAECKAAWELYVEVITRTATVPLGDNEGLLREALSSYHSLFQTTRDILRRYGPEVAESKPDGEYNFGFIAVALLNFEVRPLLSRWHPSLEDWEATRPITRSRAEHERIWAGAQQLRADLKSTGQVLTSYLDTLARACGVPKLSEAIPHLYNGYRDDGQQASGT
jgi:hypothetical protein